MKAKLLPEGFSKDIDEGIPRNNPKANKEMFVDASYQINTSLGHHLNSYDLGHRTCSTDST